ncbi:limonene-1,2-epoxide hydrolase family protein [Mycobacterium sp. 1245499.0]|uniref:limonene-1,2-epoxide hydrolase family protein n=1 Tax=Mycobacterium sp. 1245499.0 TaxID=1834074 RepID=UPI000A4A62C7|nr:limonene-1,2-epoxide hydrolase family protein [Mycobacterium sp. 1245499.0]
MTNSAESVIREFLGCFPQSDVDELVGYFSDDAVYIDGPRGVHQGIDNIRTELQSIVAMVPSTRVDIKSLATDNGTVLTERVDNFEVDGKRIAMEVMGAFDVDADGRIARWRDYYDLPTLVKQVTAATASPA